MLFSQFAPLLVYLQFSFCFCLYSTPTMAQLSRLFWSFWLLSVFVQIVPDLGSGSGLEFGFGFGPGHGHRKRYSGIFQQFIALCYFAEQVFWSSGLAASACPPGCVCICICVCVCICVYVTLLLFVGTENWFPVSAQSRLHRWLDFVPNSKHFGRVNIPRNYNIILWGSTG